MNSSAASFVGNIPEYYDRNLGPYIFDAYAEYLAARAAGLKPLRVLELAAGTGIVTRKLRDALISGAKLTATDLNAPMLTLARHKFRPEEDVAFETADAMALPFADSAFDLVLCQFGVMFFPDKPASFREAQRVLTSGGHYIFSVWDSHEANPFSRIAHRVVGEFFPADPPQFYKVPFSYHDLDAIGHDVRRAGFEDIAMDIVNHEQPLSDAAVFARGLVYGNPLIDEINARGSVDPERIVEALTGALNKEFGPAPATMPLRAIVVTARKP